MSRDLRIREQDSDQFDLQIDPVERELRNNIWWALRIAITYATFQIDFGFYEHLMNASIKLPVKSEHESTLFKLDRDNGVKVPNIWQWDMLTTSNPFYIIDHNGIRLTDHASTHSQEDPPRISEEINKMMHEIPVDLNPANTLEILLFLHILKIHSFFFNDKMKTPFITVETFSECLDSAEMVVSISELILPNQENLPLHPIIIFGLNTSACIFAMIVGSKVLDRREEAIHNLHRTQRMLTSKYITNNDSLFGQ
ncbi:uncharacterized protein VTP21DRAFT_11145 [Calcarisporiella thermophila]|uniref:uncharacterized protein n=1 Tax=Calcarisporiella thermophila TaxID=911321 RepID=UPI003743AC0B